MRCRATRCRGSMAWRAQRGGARICGQRSPAADVAALERERPCSTEHGEDRDDPRLWDAWGQLNGGDREVLALVAWEELSVADGARALGCSAPVFSVRLHRARRRLRRLLEEHRPRSSVEPVEV